MPCHMSRTTKPCLEVSRHCFFIDGLDEYHGADVKLKADLERDSINFTELPGVKTIPASRPGASFEDRFNAWPRLQLQGITLIVRIYRGVGREHPGVSLVSVSEGADIFGQENRKARQLPASSVSSFTWPCRSSESSISPPSTRTSEGSGSRGTGIVKSVTQELVGKKKTRRGRS